MSISYIPRRALNQLDSLTDAFTSYRLVYWVLLTFLGWAILTSLLGIGHLQPKWYEIAFSAGWLAIVCRAVNLGLSRFLSIAKNKESDLVTALILSLIFLPATKLSDYVVLAGAGALAMGSKYLLTFKRAHIFNPAAFGAFLMGALFHKYAAWWIGTSVLTPVVFAGGWLILRKMKRFILVTAFLAIYLFIMVVSVWNGSPAHVWHSVWLTLIGTQLLFFAYIMLTEPMTSPTIKNKYLPYTLVVALCYGSIYLNFGGFRPAFSPEEALLIGNALAFLIAFSPRYPVKLLSRAEEAEEIKSFVYARPKDLKFKPGQYMEWTLPASKSDSRGNRRYLTIASSPTEENLMIALRMPDKKSSFKDQLDKAPTGSQILASRLAGSFTLPASKSQKLAFLAGGVGITPFRSISKYLLDSAEQRDAVLLYAVNKISEVAFRELFAEAKRIGLKTHYVVSEPGPNWGGPKGRIDANIVKLAMPDYRERLFYVSGPLPFVSAMEGVLSSLGVPSHNVKADYFPGYA